MVEGSFLNGVVNLSVCLSAFPKCPESGPEIIEALGKFTWNWPQESVRETSPKQSIYGALAVRLEPCWSLGVGVSVAVL